MWLLIKTLEQKLELKNRMKYERIFKRYVVSANIRNRLGRAATILLLPIYGTAVTTATSAIVSHYIKLFLSK